MSQFDVENYLSILRKLETTDVNEEEIFSLFTDIWQCCKVPRLNYSEDVPYTEKDFCEVAKWTEIYLPYMNKLLNSLKGQVCSLSALFIKNVVISSVLVTTEYVDATTEWSNVTISLQAKESFVAICSFAGCSSPLELLLGFSKSGNSVSYLEPLLQSLVEHLNAKDWKKYVASKYSYMWILLQLRGQSSKLSEELPYLLPPSLFITDDWEQRHKIFGLKCLNIIVDNTVGSELRWYGRAAVIFDALRPLLYSREAAVLEELYPVAITTGKIIDVDPSKSIKLKSETSLDTLMQNLLREMAHEQKLIIRRVYTHVLPMLVEAMGIMALRWSDDFLDVCSEYLATHEENLMNDQISILKSLQIFVKECWPQIEHHVNKILKMASRLLYDVQINEDLEPQTRLQVNVECCKLIKLLHLAAPEKVNKMFVGLDIFTGHEEVDRVNVLITSALQLHS